MKKITFVITRAAYGSSLGQSALEAILATAIFDQHVSVIFTEDGIFQLLDGENTKKLRLKKYRKNFSQLTSYGVKQLYVDKESALQRGLMQKDLLVDTDWINHRQMTEILRHSDHILSF